MNIANHGRRALVQVALIAVLFGACAEPDKLNSERIRDRFGSFGIEIVAQDDRNRRSSLYSSDNGTRTARTEALVLFEIPVAAPVAEIHRRVAAGASIGETFRRAGWQVQKNTVHIGEIRIDDLQSSIAGRMGLVDAATVAMHVYQLHLEKAGERVFYATIIELHHPDFLSRGQLLDIYPLNAPDHLEPRDVDALAALVLAEA